MPTRSVEYGWRHFGILTFDFPRQVKKGDGHQSRNKQGKQGRGSKPELIQTVGSVFSEGINLEGGGIRRRAGGGGGGGGSGLGSVSVKSEGSSDSKFIRNNHMTKQDDEKRLEALLKDDFISDLGSEGSQVPVQLPMIDVGKAFKEEDDAEKDNDEIKSNSVMLARKKKNQILDSDDDEDDPEPMVDGVVPAKAVKQSVIDKEGASVEPSFQDLLKSQSGDLLFIQLPDHLPSRIISDPSKTDEAPIKQENGVSSTKATSNPDKVTLADLPEGYLGKIQVRKSGKCQLRLGDEYFDIELGTQVGFLQDVASVKTNPDVAKVNDKSVTVGDITMLGHIKPTHRVVMTPDWSHLFRTASKDPS